MPELFSPYLIKPNLRHKINCSHCIFWWRLKWHGLFRLLTHRWLQISQSLPRYPQRLCWKSPFCIKVWRLYSHYTYLHVLRFRNKKHNWMNTALFLCLYFSSTRLCVCVPCQQQQTHFIDYEIMIPVCLSTEYWRSNLCYQKTII